MDSGGDSGGDDDPSWFERWERRTGADNTDESTGKTESHDRDGVEDDPPERGEFGADRDRPRSGDSHTHNTGGAGNTDNTGSAGSVDRVGGTDEIGDRGTGQKTGTGDNAGGFKNERGAPFGDPHDAGSSPDPFDGTRSGHDGRPQTDAGDTSRTPETSRGEAVGDHQTGADGHRAGTDGHRADDHRADIGTPRSETGNARSDMGGSRSGTDGRRPGSNEPRNRNSGRGGENAGVVGRARWVWRTDHAGVSFVREILSSLAIVAAVGLLLFAVSGIWPPMVAVESQSMTPNLQTGDLVFVMEEHRFAASEAHPGTGVVTYRTGEDTGYQSFSQSGDVIIYRPNGVTGGTPIIHRTRFWVNDSENWYDKANADYRGGAPNCEALANCPAPHAGFITKGDSNARYDQVGDTPITGGPIGAEGRISGPVKPEWITGTGELRIPKLGCVRLWFAADTPRQCTL